MKIGLDSYSSKKREKSNLKWLFILMISAVMLIILWDPPFHDRKPQKTDHSCAVYYLLNIDGMKGLGHTAFLLTDEQGNGQLYSYNGMQYSLVECLLGRAGIGKMKMFVLSSDEVNNFLNTGDLQVEDTAECDNFDRILYRYISKEDYTRLQEGAAKYIETDTEYESLHAVMIHAEGKERIWAEEKMNEFLKQEDLLRYQIYNHNCDTVARELIALIDKEMVVYNAENEKLTPTGNYIGMCSKFSEIWGYKILGNDTWPERLFWR